MNKKLRILCPILILILGITLFFIFNPSSASFRNIKLGMTVEEVKNIEKKKNNCTQISSIHETCIVKNAKFNDYTGTVVYAFDTSKKLVNICYTITFASQKDYCTIKDIFKADKYVTLKDDEQHLDGTLRTILKKRQNQTTLGYDSSKSEIVIYIQKYKEEK